MQRNPKILRRPRLVVGRLPRQAGQDVTPLALEEVLHGHIEGVWDRQANGFDPRIAIRRTLVLKKTQRQCHPKLL